MGQTRPLFLFIFVLFPTQWQYSTNFDYKKRRWCAWDSNPGQQDGRRRAMAAPRKGTFLLLLQNCIDKITPHHYSVWPDLAKFHHFGQYFKMFGNWFKDYLVLGKAFNSLWYNGYAFGQIFIAENGQILKTQSGHLVTLPLLQLAPTSLHPSTAYPCQEKVCLWNKSVCLFPTFEILSAVAAREFSRNWKMRPFKFSHLPADNVDTQFSKIWQCWI